MSEPTSPDSDGPPDTAGVGPEMPQDGTDPTTEPSDTGTDAEADSSGLGPNGERLEGADYWKARARENEQRAKTARQELEQLKRTRYRVDQHGELGPVLTDADHDFRGPAEVAAATAA